MINKWRKENKKVVLLSASKKDLLIEQLDHFNITNLFDEILGTDTINAVGKDYLAKEYLEKNHVNKDTTIMIGDTIHDDEVANVLGVSSFLIAKGHQSKTRLMTTKAIVLNDIKEILDYIE